ncbi:hypothetical protein PRIPAC_91082 [Pristionchus pacificus]|uniref:Glutathione S-transferase kappa n=1 Tax=Pristionchus pacificus TaxID=54126 RepID=A0A454Y3V5_PRIPA|nr:hypothetical protein PRIPAC_91082 [Pristionchus pacificus]|eukprot:PDM62246.1 gstk-2 [Pristionchus pacificus]
MSRNHTIKLYYDIISPYSFIGFEALLRYRVVWPIDVVLKPICLGGLFRDVGNTPPAVYMAKELQMISRHFGIPMNVPKNFEDFVMKANTVDACRLAIAAQKLRPEKAEEVSRQLFDRFWIDNKPVKSEEDLRECLKRAMVDAPGVEELMGLIKKPEIKEALKKNTKEAQDIGAFGLPWIEVNNAGGGRETYFGSDRLPIIGEFIGQTYHGPLRHLSLF